MYRFDLIFLILDPQDELYDRKLANHLVSLYFHAQDSAEEEFLVSLIAEMGWRKTVKKALPGHYSCFM